MIFRYEKGSFESISFRDFIRAPASFTTTPIVIYEPFKGAQPVCDPICDERISSADLSRVVHQTFKVTPILFKQYRLWTLAASTLSLFAIRELQESMKAFPWGDLVCGSAADPEDLFFDVKPDTPFLSAFRPTQSAVRSSSPAKLAATPPVSLMARRSQQATTLQTTFTRSTPLIGEVSLLGSNEYDKIVDSLWIGSENAARNGNLLSSLGITHVVHLNGSEARSGYPSGFQYAIVRLSDSPFEELSQEFWESVKFVIEAIEAGGAVFVHCRRGICRSAAFCVAYLMESRNLPFDAALTLVKQKRPICEINQGFTDQLKAHESAMKRRSTGRGRGPLLIRTRPA
jgi:protein-tyrosine phosphatase